MADEPTPGELRRSLDDVRQDMRERYTALGARLDALSASLVGQPVYQAHVDTARREHDELAKDIAELGARFEADQKQRAADRRLILMALFTSILAPLALLVVQTFLRGKGAAP